MFCFLRLWLLSDRSMKKLHHSSMTFATVGVHTIFVSLVLWEPPQTKQTCVYSKTNLFVFHFFSLNFGILVSLVHCTECVPYIVFLPTQVHYQSSGESCPWHYLPLTMDKHSVSKPAAPVSLAAASTVSFLSRQNTSLSRQNTSLSRQKWYLRQLPPMIVTWPSCIQQSVATALSLYGSTVCSSKEPCYLLG